MKERELIQKLHNGDKEAAGLIIERYYADVFVFIWFNLKRMLMILRRKVF